MSVLKPCPFCGSSVLQCVTLGARKGFETDIHCDECSASIHTITYDTEAEAVSAAMLAWNRRTEVVG